MDPRKENPNCEGERRRDAAHAMLEARRTRLIRQARRVSLMVLLKSETATLDAALICRSPRSQFRHDARAVQPAGR